MGRLALTVSYDGSDFAGSQVQPGARTVQGVLNASLSALFGRPTGTEFAGRTDRGVHAAGQVVGCADERADLDRETIRRALNARLPEDLAVQSVGRRRPSFHARYDALSREYRYRLWTGERSPESRMQVWQRRAELDLWSMGDAAARLIGRHDFSSFASGGEGVPWSPRRAQPRGRTRTVLHCSLREREPWWAPEWGMRDRLVELRIVASGFLPRMVRNIMAALVVVGEGRHPPAWIDTLIAAQDRRLGPPTAPAHGLTLWKVAYPDEIDLS